LLNQLMQPGQFRKFPKSGRLGQLYPKGRLIFFFFTQQYRLFSNYSAFYK
jgi:hypothetical protein